MLIGHTLTHIFPERHYLRAQDAVAIVFEFYYDAGSAGQKLTLKIGMN